MTNLRTGVIATKIGMSQIFQQNGVAIPVTLLRVDRNVVLSVKSMEKHGYQALQIGYGKRKKMRKPQQAIANGAGVESFFCSKEFRVSDEHMMEVGAIIGTTHFRAGQIVDVSSVSIGKGFAGGMKKYGFAGLEASHGVSLGHRAIGSTGQRQDPGKVFKGKKMPGQMGNKRVTKQNLQIVEIDQELSVIVIKGSLPGNPGQVVYVTDAVKFGYVG